MIERHLFSLMLLLGAPLLLQAQPDTLQRQHGDRTGNTGGEPDLAIVQQARSRVLAGLRSGNIDDARAAYTDAVTLCKHGRVRAFLEIETFILAYWFASYENVFAADSIEHDAEQGNHLYPPEDSLDLELRDLTFEHSGELYRTFTKTIADPEQNDYLALFFDWLTYTDLDPDMSEEECENAIETKLTPHAKEFLTAYEHSPFCPFVRQHFILTRNLSRWGLGVDGGLGILSPTGPVDAYLRPQMSFGAGCEAAYDRLILTLGGDFGFANTVRKLFTNGGNALPTDPTYNQTLIYLNAGYAVSESRIVKLTPHAGIGGFFVAVSEADKDIPGADVSMSGAVFQYGLNLDFKLTAGDEDTRDGTLSSYYGLRAAVDYFTFLGSDPVLSGGVLRVRLTLALFYRPSAWNY